VAEVVRNSEYRRRSKRITQPTPEACGERQVVAVPVGIPDAASTVQFVGRMSRAGVSRADDEPRRRYIRRPIDG
jgi:hypothetical protein